MLKTSGITKEDVSADPQRVLDVLQFHMQGPPPKLPTTGALKTAESAALKIIKDNPNKFYKKVRKLGEGFVLFCYSHQIWSSLPGNVDEILTQTPHPKTR